MLIKHISAIIFTTCLIFIVPVRCGCRKQEINECESICRVNELGKYGCELRGAVILPNLPLLEASLPRVRPVIDMATKKIRDDGILPDFINITWHEFDDECESAISAISAFDAYRSKCSHFILGPSCEYSVAAVSRIAKYFYNDGLNVITPGAFAYNFEEPKKTCKEEFHMLQRVGTLSFEKVSKFMLELMRNFKWKRATLLYDRNGCYKIGGNQTCHLAMSSIAKIFQKENFEWSPHVFETDVAVNLTEKLIRDVGTNHSSK